MKTFTPRCYNTSCIDIIAIWVRVRGLPNDHKVLNCCSSRRIICLIRFKSCPLAISNFEVQEPDGSEQFTQNSIFIIFPRYEILEDAFNNRVVCFWIKRRSSFWGVPFARTLSCMHLKNTQSKSSVRMSSVVPAFLYLYLRRTDISCRRRTIWVRFNFVPNSVPLRSTCTIVS